MNLIKLSPEPDDGLRRQDGESYIQVDPGIELEWGHTKALLTLGSLAGMDLTNPRNAETAAKALPRATDLLAMAVRGWRWLDRRGRPIDVSPADNPEVFDSLTMDEITWMLSSVSGIVKEEATPKNS